MSDIKQLLKLRALTVCDPRDSECLTKAADRIAELEAEVERWREWYGKADFWSDPSLFHDWLKQSPGATDDD